MKKIKCEETEKAEVISTEEILDNALYFFNNSPYTATVKNMLSSDYKKRFIAEYHQTSLRYEKLKQFCNKIEGTQLYNKEHCGKDFKAEPMHTCSLELLRKQQAIMGEYLHILELRAVMEGIDIHE